MTGFLGRFHQSVAARVRRTSNGRKLLLAFLVGCSISVAKQAFAGDPDPGGAKTGVATDAQLGSGDAVIPAEPTDKTDKEYDKKKKDYDEFMAKTKTGEPVALKLADAVGQNRVAINLMWTLVTGFLVMFMQAGFALVETGLCRAKNASHTMFMNFMVYALGMTGFWICGFALMYGATAVGSLGGTGGLDAAAEIGPTIAGHKFGLFAIKGFFLGPNVYDVGVFSIFLFQMVFMDTAATIPTGALAERWTLKSFYLFAFFMSMILYPMFGNWAWGGGWLSQLGANFGLGHGYVDFAGSGVVHSVGGLCGLAGAIVLGPRIGKYNKDGSVNPIPAHHVPMALLGTFILAFGWFGFNPGSTLGASGGGLNRIGIIATVTMLAGAAGAISAMGYLILTTSKPDPTMCANGMLAGLVAITAPSGFVGAPAGFLIGAIAGVLVCVSVRFWDKLRVDDPVGAISVHGVCGLWGVLSVGLLADGTTAYTGGPGGALGWNGVAKPVAGLFYGDPGQLVAQVIGCVTLLVWAFGLSFAYFKIADKVAKMRVTPEVELEGLDMDETGILAYPDFAVRTGGGIGHAMVEAVPETVTARATVTKPVLES